MSSAQPTGAAIYQQAQRWLRVGCFELLAHDPRALLRPAVGGRAEGPSAAVLDSRTLRSTPESGARAGRDGHQRTRGSKLHLAVDTLGHLRALHVTPASADGRAAVAELAGAVQDATGGNVEPAFVDRGCTGERPAEAAQAQGIAPAVVGLPGWTMPSSNGRGLVLLPRRWVVERTKLRLDGTPPQAGPRRRALARSARRAAHGRLRHPDAAKSRQLGPGS